MLNHAWPKTACILLIHRDFEFARHKALEYAAQQLSSPSHAAKRLMDAGTHPDFRYLEPASGSQWIGIDSIRALTEWALHTPRLSHQKVAIIAAADALNIQAGNALLKTLEESSAQTLFVLLTHQPALVLATIRSRCAFYPLHNPNTEPLAVMMADLVPGMQTDLKGLGFGDTDPLTLSQQWIAKHGLQVILKGLWGVLVVMQQDEATQGRLIQRQDWWSYVDKLLQAQKSLTEGAVVHEGLLLGSLLIEYAAIMRV